MQTTNKLQANSSSVVAQKLKWSIAIALHFRKKRFEFFKTLIAPLPRPLHILDVGGMPVFWEYMEFTEDDVKITSYNTEPIETTSANITSMVGDARDMHEFKDKEFEVVFSNSVIEHVGTYDQQRKMAEEIERVGKRYIVQTPNRYFPIEPHAFFPFFQFFPLGLKVFVAAHAPDLGWRVAHIGELTTIRLMTEKELRRVFPGAKVYKEKFLGLTKSLTIYKGW